MVLSRAGSTVLAPSQPPRPAQTSATARSRLAVVPGITHASSLEPERTERRLLKRAEGHSFGGIQRRVDKPASDSEARDDANENPALRALAAEDCVPEMEQRRLEQIYAVAE